MGEAGGPSKRKREAGGQRGGEYGRDGGQVDRESVEAAGWEAEVADYLPPIPFEKPGRADKAGRREWNKRPSYVRKLMRFRERVASEYYETSDVRGVARSLRVLKTLFHLSTSLTHMSAELVSLTGSGDVGVRQALTV